jgi:hypothetical protein
LIIFRKSRIFSLCVNANQKCQVFCKLEMSVIYGYEFIFLLLDIRLKGFDFLFGYGFVF